MSLPSARLQGIAFQASFSWQSALVSSNFERLQNPTLSKFTFHLPKIPCLMCSTQTRETPWDYADLSTGEIQKLYSFGSMSKHCYGENCRVFIDKTGN